MAGLNKFLKEKEDEYFSSGCKMIKLKLQVVLYYLVGDTFFIVYPWRVVNTTNFMWLRSFPANLILAVSLPLQGCLQGLACPPLRLFGNLTRGMGFLRNGIRGHEGHFLSIILSNSSHNVTEWKIIAVFWTSSSILMRLRFNKVVVYLMRFRFYYITRLFYFP